MGVFARVFPFGTTVFLILTGLCEVPVTGMRNIAFPEKSSGPARSRFCCAKDRLSPRCPFPRWKKWEVSHSRRNPRSLQDFAFAKRKTGFLPVVFSLAGRNAKYRISGEALAVCKTALSLHERPIFSPLCFPSLEGMGSIPFPEKSSGPARPRFCSAKDRISLRCSLPPSYRFHGVFSLDFG